MDRLRAWGLSASVVAGVAAPGWAADPPGDAKPWYTKMFAGKPDPKPAESRPAPAAPLAPETLADALRAEQDAYLRRLDVCTKLRQVAVESNDEKLLEKADGLEQQATALYHQRTARLGVRGGPKGSYSPTVVAAKPEATLDKTLGTGAATTPLIATKQAADGKPATAQARQWKVVPE